MSVLPRLVLFAGLSFSLAGFGQELDFERFVPSDLLQHYYNFGAAQKLKFKGEPIKNGRRIVVLGALEDKSLDGKGTYVDLRGTPPMGGGRGVVRIYLPSQELDKLQGASYVYESLLHQGTREIAVEATLVGLNRYGTLEMRDGYLIPWASVLLESRTERGNPSLPSNSASAGQSPYDWSGGFRYPKVGFAWSAASIREIDFANFTYPWDVLVNSKPVSRSVRLRSGQIAKQQDITEDVKLAAVTYGDVNGDGVDDAIVTLSVKSNGIIPDRSWTCRVFIYSLQASSVVFLAEFDASFILRRVGAANGQLVIEHDEIGDSGMCCPIARIESRYKWSTGRFVMSGITRAQLPR